MVWVCVVVCLKKKMREFLEPKDMNAVQKMKYLSTVSKVCKEMDSRLGFSDKSVAEVHCMYFSLRNSF